MLSKIERGARFKDYWGCVEWLRDAGIVNVCHCLNFPELPLKGNYDASRYKLYLADSGLLLAQLDDEVQEDLRGRKNLNTYGGGLFENIVAEAIKKSGGELYYYRREEYRKYMVPFGTGLAVMLPVTDNNAPCGMASFSALVSELTQKLPVIVTTPELNVAVSKTRSSAKSALSVVAEVTAEKSSVSPAAGATPPSQLPPSLKLPFAALPFHTTFAAHAAPVAIAVAIASTAAKQCAVCLLVGVFFCWFFIMVVSG